MIDGLVNWWVGLGLFKKSIRTYYLSKALALLISAVKVISMFTLTVTCFSCARKTVWVPESLQVNQLGLKYEFSSARKRWWFILQEFLIYTQ